MWSKDTVCDRDWLLQNVPGATALIVLVTDKVSLNTDHNLGFMFSFFRPADRC